MDNIDVDALTAAVSLVGHAGAKSFEFGYLHDDVPIDKADWWAMAQYQGTKVIVEHKTSPIEAAEALAMTLLTGAKCTWCEGLVAFNTEGAIAYPGMTMFDGTQMPTDQDALVAMGQCLWRRIGKRWEPGCIHGHSTAPKAPKDRAARRRLAREYEATRPKEK